MAIFKTFSRGAFLSGNKKVAADFLPAHERRLMSEKRLVGRETRLQVEPGANSLMVS